LPRRSHWRSFISIFTRALAIGVVIGFGSLTTVVAQGTDPAIGMWRLNVEKSTYTPGPGPKSQTVKYETSSMGTTVTTEGVAADGTATMTKYTTKYDGKAVTLTGSANADTASLKRIDARTIERTDMKAGKKVSTIRRTVAEDGRSMTVVNTGSDASGHPTTSTSVYDKQ